MKEVHDIAMNVCASVVEGQLLPQAEVIIIYTEPHYRVDGDEMKQQRHTGSIRLMMGPKRMRAMAAGLISAADVVEQEIGDAVYAAMAEVQLKLKEEKPESSTTDGATSTDDGSQTG